MKRAHFIPVSIAIWILVFLVSYVVNLKVEKTKEINHALNGGRAFFKQTVLSRAWNAGHGGVYVPVDHRIKPNPYLEDEKREIVTTDGQVLTKINPAFMTRLISEISVKKENVKLHITSLKPLNPGNEPFSWEYEILKSFEKESDEAGAFFMNGSKREFRYMAPLYVKKDCLACHAKQGYKLGDIRGGISVIFPFPSTGMNLGLLISHLIAIAAGVTGLYLFGMTMEKKREELVKAKEAAAEASKTKKEFLTNISHEIRTPMNGVVGMAELLMETDLNEEQLNYAACITRSGDELIALINDVLDYSKIESGKFELDQIDFDMIILIEDICETLSANAHNKGLEIAGLVHDEVPPLLKGDPRRIRQMLINLLGNAIKFTQEGEVSVVVSLIKHTNIDVTLLFKVRDTGIGIPEDKLKTIFKSYSQVDSSSTRKSGGTGLGLAISKRLVEMMDGKIGVKSELGQGSEFWFTANFEKQESTVIADAQGNREDVKILIVDDNDIVGEIFTEYLKTRPYFIIDTVPDSKEALEQLQLAAKNNHPYKLVIIDTNMPGLDGPILGKKIKSIPEIADSILILTTSGGFRGDASKMEQIGFSAYLTKPLKREILIDCIEAVIHKKSNSSIITKYSLGELQRELPYFDKKLDILFADDNKLNRKVTVGMLEKMGHFVSTAMNGVEALEYYKKQKFDLVLLDVSMPVMFGVEAVKEIRMIEAERSETSPVPVIAITANALRGDKERYLKAGMNYYIAKPIKRKVLVEAIKKFTDAV